MFSNNYADTDSAIAAYMTSISTPVVIKDCIFKDNNSTSNTISMKNSKATITNCKFLNNNATIYSANLFLSFSEVSMSGTTMKDDESANPSKAMTKTSI
jgi:hypothetical protein